jgi:hypothetical protein
MIEAYAFIAGWVFCWTISHWKEDAKMTRHDRDMMALHGIIFLVATLLLVVFAIPEHK